MTMPTAMALAAPAGGTVSQGAAGGTQQAAGAANLLVAGRASGASGGQSGGTFGRMLVSHVTNAEAAPHQPNQSQSVHWLSAGLVNGELAELLAGSERKPVIEQLDELIRLTEEYTEPLTGGQQAEIDAALAELQALMAALFGIEWSIRPETQTEEQTAVRAGQFGDPAESLPRTGLYETLALLRSFLADGAFRALNKQENVLLQAQFDRLHQALTAGKDMTADGGNIPEGAVARITVTDGRHTFEPMLNRLAHQPLNASVAAAVAEMTQQGAAREASAQAGETLFVRALATAANAVQQQTSTQPLHDNGQPQAADTVELMQTVQAIQQPAAQTANVKAEAAVRQTMQHVPVERFHELVAGMAVRQLNLSTSGGVSEARIQLVPEHLGQLEIRITVQNGQLTAQFMTESLAAREMIENQFVVLRGALQTHGIQVERLEAAFGSVAAQSQLSQEQRGRGGQYEQGGDGRRRPQDAAPVFEAELIEQTAIRELGYGRAINVKA